MAKTHIGILELDRETSLPNLRSSKGGLGFEGTTPKFWNGTAWAAVSASGGVTTWDELYDLDKSMTIDSTSMTFALTHATNDGVTFTAGSGSAGDVIQITNSGSGSDIKGTSNTWSVSKAGAGDFVSVTGDSVVVGDGAGAGTLASSGNYDLILSTGNATSSILTITDGANGDATFTMNGTGKVVVAGTTETNVGFQVTNGDVNVADGSVTITDDDNASSLVVTNATITSGNMVTLTGDAVDSGSILYIDNGGASLTTGYFINCNDDGVSDFTVGADGATTITGTVASSVGLTVVGVQTNENTVAITSSGVTASDKASLLLNPSGNIASGGNVLRIAPSGAPNAGAIAFEYVGASKTCQAMYIDGDSTGVAVVAINGGGALTDNNAVLNVTSDGNIASGGNVLRVAPAGTPASGAIYAEFNFTGITDTNENIGVKIDAGGKKVQALYVDGDPLAGSLGYMHTDGAIAADKAVLEINSEASSSNADSSVLRVEQGATDGVANVITLKQDDVDKPFISFETTVGTGNAVQAVAALSITATHYVMVDIEGVGTRYFSVGTLA